MSNDVYANGREVSCKAADGKSICSFPDVCLSPPSPPAGPVPIPYPNTAFAKDTTSGSKKVKISGKEIILKNKSYFKKSTGDEAATKSLGMGVVTHQIQGKVYFTSWSFDVKVEGENVVRHLDLTTHNHMSQPGNTPPWTYIDSMTAPTMEQACDEGGKSASEGYEKLSPSTKKKPVTVSGAVFVPEDGGTPTGTASSSAVSSNMVLRGGKYRDYSKGIKKKEESNVPCPSTGGKFEYRETLRPKQGHAESKIIESLYEDGPPKGKLYLKIVDNDGNNKPVCPDCQRLIDCVNEENDLEVVVCP